ncbi:hypothetical protein J2S70_000525 [Trueperella bonasi]|uniref:Aminoglycoside phosphotransferase domain-containing protein n=1 Tax=Trueperella bonasi TaxID=312286 RepID=A0ABT9NEW9_9ACTO|nr:phosphotransferase [Trueperella bonasi]MDP9805943.1 hypothetical protein [Trueperella bonasi]
MGVSDERRALALLTGQSAGDMLRLALDEAGILRSWHVHAVNHRPGASVSVGYSLVWDRFDGERRLREDLYLLASTARIRRERLERAGAKTLYAGGLPVHVWEYPADPELPALELACDPEKLSAFIGQHVDIELLGYRPTRRAVLKIEGETERYYVKVVRPGVVEALTARHAAFDQAKVPAPTVVTATKDGLVLTSALPGVALSTSYASGKNLDATFDSLTRTLDALPIIGRALRRRPVWADRCEHYAHAASIAMPEITGRAREAAAAIRQYRSTADYGPLVPTHGDFYEANILISPTTGRVSGLLDLDSFGPGYRADDWGCLLGHLSVLPGLNSRYAQAQAIADRWFDRLRSKVDPVALAASAAGVVLSLVASPRHRGRKNWKSQVRSRLDVVEWWLAKAGEADAALPARLPANRA